MTPVIGIDLGTTYSAVAHMNSYGQAELIPNLDGELLTPSVIDFSVDPPLVGLQAKERQAQGEEEIEAFFKRAMHIPHYQLEYFGKVYGAAEMSGLVLSYLKASAEQFFNTSVTDAVITVPAYFQESQRSQTIKAAKLAGLNVLRLINEPTAAILAYQRIPGLYLVFDLGGGTFDVTLSKVDSDSINILEIAGDHELGGKDWDDALLRYVAHRFLEDTGEDIFESSIMELVTNVEKAKIALTQRVETPLKVIGRQTSRTYTITRKTFEELTQWLVNRTFSRVDYILENQQVDWQTLSGVLLVGGSTRMPIIRQEIERRLGKPPLSGVHPDQAVAIGAAFEAQRLYNEQHSVLGVPTGSEQGQLRILPQLNDITAHSLGIVAEHADSAGSYLNSIIIPKGHAVPARSLKRYSFMVTDPHNDRLEVYITQGEYTDLFSDGLSFLELRVVSGFEAQGEHVVDVALEYDQNAVVNVYAETKGKRLRVHNEPLPPDIPARFDNATHRERLTVYLIFDVSGSMRNAPLLEAKAAAKEFVATLQPDALTHIGIMTVADHAQVIHKPTNDTDALIAAIDSITIGYRQGNKGEPFELLNQELESVIGQKFAVLMADGVWVNPQRAIANARICHKNNIDIISVGFGAQNIKFLQHVASAGRETIKAPTGQLTSAYNSIARELKQYKLSGR